MQLRQQLASGYLKPDMVGTHAARFGGGLKHCHTSTPGTRCSPSTDTMDAMDFTDLFGDASMDQLLHDLLDSDQNTSSWLPPTDGLSGPASLPPVHPVVPWRCLDASHGAHCSRCVLMRPGGVVAAVC